MNRFFLVLTAFLFLIPQNAKALDPKAPREERATGMVYVETPNPDDKIVLEPQREGQKEIKLSNKKDQLVPVGDYLVKVEIKPEYHYEQALTVRPTERHEVIVPGFGNLRVNGECSEVTILKDGKEIDKIKCGQIRTLTSGAYDLKIKVGKHTLDQPVAIVTNTLRQVDIQF